MRRRTTRRPWLATAGLLAGLLFSTPAHATVAVQLSRVELIQRSDLVVRATVLGSSYAWNQDHTQIVTLTHLRVANYLKGTGPQDLTLRQFGGTIDGLVSRVAGDGHFTQGEDTVLFLRRGTESGLVFLTAMTQAAYEVQHASDGSLHVRRDLSDVTFAQQKNGQMVLVEPSGEPDESLEHLAQDVAAYGGGAR